MGCALIYLMLWVTTMPFLTEELHVKAAPDSSWELTRPVIYETHEHDLITVPDGFITDLASVPRLARPVVSVHGDHSMAAVVHDYLYQNRIGTRAWADMVFRQALQDVGVGTIKRYSMWAAVRVGGWLYWNS